MARKKKVLQDTARKLISFTTPRSFVSEQFRTLRTNITFSSPDADIRTMVVTSAAPSEGKSTTSANLAVVYAQEGKNVLLVDGDMRKPTTHHTFHMGNTIGLSSVLTRQSSIEEAVRTTVVDRLDLLTCGPIPPNPAELLSSKSMDMLIQQLKERYDLIIFDAPPILSVTDGQILSNKCDGTILVVSSGNTEKDMALKAKEAIVSSNSRLIGAVLNNFELPKDSNYYQYYGTTE
ncbi:CpsD/CapB family tyrosine-protein kinase [Planococcus faecalis]|uniref:non-specific protein-tyrosine kinase n=1 Tax=Planococcus faecalis TaxID=1598147 RepID=A0ABM6IV54_9BACL|nr:CpsD/CapB family tyrosine-protein kinase [Planococcus faecalis]AQU80228.1 capsular biosynthesis protein [Planococcus faecalis]OHX51969.1 capsular biosynthesis protein [Planococcus faecalis]